MTRERLLPPLVALIVLHSAVLGLAAVVAPDWGLQFTGFGGLELARGPQPWIVPVSLAGDAAMAIAVALLVVPLRKR